METQPVERPSDLTASWLSAAIGAGEVADFETERIGTGQMSECYRVKVSYSDGAAGPESVVLKVAASDPVSRQTGLALGLYEREVRFYADIAPRLGGPIAPCYHAGIDTSTGVFDLLLGDAVPAVVGNEIAGATIEQATIGVVELGRLHGPLLGDTSLADASWLNRDAPLNQSMIAPLYAGFLDRYGDQIAPSHRMVCERLVGAFDAYLAAEAQRNTIQGLVHGDYRLDNMLFGAEGADRALTVVDWQTVSWGPPLTDLAYFLGCALRTDDRRAHYDSLLRAYHEALGPHAPITLADIAEGVRRQAFFGVMMAIVSSMLVERTERGDQMFMTMLQRHCDHVLDTDALATLPNAMAPEPLRRRKTTNSLMRRRTSRCGVRAGMPTSSMRHRDSAAGSGSVWWPTSGPPGFRCCCADPTFRPWPCWITKFRCPRTRGCCPPMPSKSPTPPTSHCGPTVSTCGRRGSPTPTRRRYCVASREHPST